MRTAAILFVLNKRLLLNARRYYRMNPAALTVCAKNLPRNRINPTRSKGLAVPSESRKTTSKKPGHNGITGARLSQKPTSKQRFQLWRLRESYPGNENSRGAGRDDRAAAIIFITDKRATSFFDPARSTRRRQQPAKRFPKQINRFSVPKTLRYHGSCRLLSERNLR